MQPGVIIKGGLENWQIVQQHQGKGKISLSGSWSLPEELGGRGGAVFARIMHEESNVTVVHWTKAQRQDETSWELTFDNVPAGGLYRIETTVAYERMEYDSIEFGYRGDIVHHVGVGDLFVIAGQSNAVGYGKGPFTDTPELGVHVLRNSGRWDLATHPLNDSTATISPVNMEKYNPAHSPFVHFGKIIRKETGWPVGLLQTSLGGSALKSWNPGESGELYANMLKVIRAQGGAVCGILWYQGCTDAIDGGRTGIHKSYLARFADMVASLRKDLGDATLPLFTCQLNRYAEGYNPEGDVRWGILREAQRQAAKTIPHVFISPTTDCPVSDCVHTGPAGNILLAERLARTVLSELYGGTYWHRAPEIREARKMSENTVVLTFDNINLKLYLNDVQAMDLCFTICDDEGELKIKHYKMVNNDGVLLELDRELGKNAMIHGAYEQNPKHFIPMDRGSFLPMLSFYGFKITSA